MIDDNTDLVKLLADFRDVYRQRDAAKTPAERAKFHAIVVTMRADWQAYNGGDGGELYELAFGNYQGEDG